jgi:hypothetical protein
MVMDPAASEFATELTPMPSGIDAVRSAMMANFEQADLDVPAFLRKRGETM